MARLVCHHQNLGSHSHSKFAGTTGDNCVLTDIALSFTCFKLKSDEVLWDGSKGVSFSKSLRVQKAVAAAIWLGVSEQHRWPRAQLL